MPVPARLRSRSPVTVLEPPAQRATCPAAPPLTGQVGLGQLVEVSGERWPEAHLPPGKGPKSSEGSDRAVPPATDRCPPAPRDSALPAQETARAVDECGSR